MPRILHRCAGMHTEACAHEQKIDEGQHAKRRSEQHHPIGRVALGIHAIGRRYRRGFDNTDRAIQADISELTLNFFRLPGAESQTFAVRCPSGQWVGAIEAASLSGGPDQRLLNVRSFFHHPQ
jgi:hypothetical protein